MQTEEEVASEEADDLHKEAATVKA